MSNVQIVSLSGEGRGTLSRALQSEMDKRGIIWGFQLGKCDAAFSLAGRMYIRHPGAMTELEMEASYEVNYLIPVECIEYHLRNWQLDGTPGHMVVISSIAARAGNPCAEDYAAMKAALSKYCELRARSARAYGIKLTVVHLGGMAGGFWDAAAEGGVPEDVLARIRPDPEKALQPDEVAKALCDLLWMADNVVPSEITLVARAYQ